MQSGRPAVKRVAVFSIIHPGPKRGADMHLGLGDNVGRQQVERALHDVPGFGHPVNNVLEHLDVPLHLHCKRHRLCYV
jgi:hypothetical protein